MRKNLLFITLALCVGFVSCQKDDLGRLVDVETSTPNETKFIKSGLKTEVSSNGITSWAKNDEVFIVDVNGIPRTFTNTTGTYSTVATFSGKLLAGMGTREYYAYHSALKSPITLNDYKITVTREDLEFLSDDDFNAVRKGEYCSMVAVPMSFDAENPNDPKNFNFHHLNSLIEARISIEDGLGDYEFDKAEYTITAIAPINDTYSEYNDYAPFNTSVTVNMKDISVDPVIIPFTEGSEKVNKISSVITYPEVVTLAERHTSGTQYYDLPMYVLPTESWFTCQIDIVFTKGEEKVLHLRDIFGFKGLKVAGLNDPSFSRSNIVTEP